jgi:hypothetical protein
MRPQSLKRLLDSIVLQIFTPYEITIVDGLLNSGLFNQMGLNAIKKGKLKFQSVVIAKKNIEHYRKVINEF